MIELILISVNLGFQVIERIFKYSKKRSKLKSECCGGKIEYETEKEKPK